ncbi:hypothetical protein EXN66_Car003264 [Channa argus]|uniref:Apolipoprotein M n=1 Tax=Channa argus TaxID=215402 RepID=A0A6G1PBI0_CHAAH|nr:hypothetical protein EXN66_Car003264 [Channa argus]
MFLSNAWLKITTANENGGLNAVYFYKMGGLCFKLSANFTVESNTISAVQPYAMSATLLKTGCPDCLVFFGKHTIGGSTYTTLQLMSRRSMVTNAELDEFKKQAECLNLYSPAFLEPEKGLCSDDLTQEIGTTDVTNVMNGMASEAFEKFNTIINSENGVQTLIKIISSGIDTLKNN